jgi:eukaryotic-like serine/threonine-protein kinase
MDLTEEAAGRLIGGRYEIHELLGRGAFGAVWRATDTKLRRDVAVKLVAVDRLATEEQRAEAIGRFEREARAIAALNHPNVVTAHDYGVDSGRPYLVMELIVGDSVASLVRSERLPLARVLSIAADVCAGLAAAHEAGLVHRDLKPANLMVVTKTDQVKIVDFGVAHVASASSMTRSGQVLGTLPYLAPEQFRAGGLDGRADLYSLGCVIHELAAGRSPYTATTNAQWVAAHLYDKPAPLRRHLDGAPADLEALLLHLLAKKPAKRPASAGEVGARLVGIRAACQRNYATGRAALPPRPGAGEPRDTLVDRPSRRGRRLSLVVVVLLAIAGGLLLLRPWASGGTPQSTGSLQPTPSTSPTLAVAAVRLTGGGATLTVTGQVRTRDGQSCGGGLVLVTDDGTQVHLQVAADAKIPSDLVRAGARVTVTGVDTPYQKATATQTGGGVVFPWLTGCPSPGGYLSVREARPA